MGKYMRRKSKPDDGDDKMVQNINVMDISALGVRTRAKTLALKKTQRRVPASVAEANSSSSGYLQLRSRRLVRLKPPIYKKLRRISSGGGGGGENNVNNKDCPKLGNPNFGNCSGSACSSPNWGVRVDGGEKPVSGSGSGWKESGGGGGDDVDGCFGENVLLLDSDSRERSTRESTPSNMIRDPDAINTPGSTTRPTCSVEATHRSQNSTQRHIPTSREMEEFFAGAEEQQQREFIDKYNFDPANDKPLPGRFEWKRVKP